MKMSVLMSREMRFPGALRKISSSPKRRTPFWLTLLISTVYQVSVVMSTLLAVRRVAGSPWPSWFWSNKGQQIWAKLWPYFANGSVYSHKFCVHLTCTCTYIFYVNININVNKSWQYTFHNIKSDMTKYLCTCKRQWRYSSYIKLKSTIPLCPHPLLQTFKVCRDHQPGTCYYKQLRLIQMEWLNLMPIATL